MEYSKNIKWNKVKALFGGSFDPPHLGHLEAVRGILKNPGIQSVIILPTGNPPHKKARASLKHRIEMTRLNFSSLSKSVQISTFEAEDKPSYTYFTLLTLKQQYTHLAFILGSDQLKQLPSWYRFPEVLKLCHWIVLKREGTTEAEYKTRMESFKQWAHFQSFPTAAPAISSTSIRESIAKTGRVPPGVLVPEVLEYLENHSLYGMGGGESLWFP